MAKIRTWDYEKVAESRVIEGNTVELDIRLLKLENLQDYINSGKKTIKFREKRNPKNYGIRGLSVSHTCEEIKSQNLDVTNERRWLDIGDKNIRIELKGNTLLFCDKFFGFRISGGSLTIDLGGGTIDCGLEVAQAQNWCNLEEPNAELRLDNASFFKIGDNICSSFSGTNSTYNTNFCYLDNAPTDTNILTGFNFVKGQKETGPPIIPRNAYVTNGCIWGGEAPTFSGTGDIIIKNGFVQNGLNYFKFINSNEDTSLDVELNCLHFCGQFLDGLIMGSENVHTTPLGNINTDIQSCYFGKSYDVAKQGIAWNSTGNLLINRCHFARGNHDPEVYQDIDLDTTNSTPGNITISNSVFDGKKKNFLDYNDNPNPYKIGHHYIESFGNKYRFMYLNCLSVFQIRFVNNLVITNCLFENYEKQLIITQLTKFPFKINSIQCDNSIHNSCTPLTIDFLLPEKSQSNLLDEGGLLKRNAQGSLVYLDDLENCDLGPVKFSNCIFQDVRQFWAAFLDYKSDLTTLYPEIKAPIQLTRELLSNHITFENCSFVKNKPDSRNTIGSQIPNQTVGNQNFINTTIINYTNDAHYFGVYVKMNNETGLPEGDYKLNDLTLKGYLKILRGRVIIRESINHGNPTEPNAPTLEVKYFNKDQFVMFDPKWAESSYKEARVPLWALKNTDRVMSHHLTPSHQYNSGSLDEHDRTVSDFINKKRNQTDQIKAFFNSL